jgi:hypothetical protein
MAKGTRYASIDRRRVRERSPPLTESARGSYEIDGATSRTLRRFAPFEPESRSLATRIIRGSSRWRRRLFAGRRRALGDRPAPLRRFEPGVFSGQAVEIALEPVGVQSMGTRASLQLGLA